MGTVKRVETMKRVVLFTTVLAIAASALAGDTDVEKLQAELARLEARVKLLEADNARLKGHLARLKSENAEMAKELGREEPTGDPETYLVYWDQPRTKKWFDEMYLKYAKNMTVDCSGPKDYYYDIGEDRLKQNRHLRKGRWIRIVAATITDITGPTTMEISIPELTYRNPAYHRSNHHPKEITHQAQEGTIRCDTTDHEKGNRFTGELVRLSGRLYPYELPTKTQFKKALEGGHRLVQYRYKKDGTVDRTNER